MALRAQAAPGLGLKKAPDARILQGQAALDFLMTYGWALLLVALAAAAIVSLGILDVGSFMGSRSVGFSQLTPLGWQLQSDGAFAVKLKNNAGVDVNITSITATWNDQSANCSDVPVSLNQSAESGTLHFSFPQPLPQGTSYSIRLNMDYVDTEAGFYYVDSGTLSGKVT